MLRMPVAEFSNSSLRHLLQMNAQGVSLPTIASTFGYKADDTEMLREELQLLIDEGFATYDPKRMFQATAPISDLVVARVKADQSRSRLAKEIELSIDGLPDDFPFKVVMKATAMRAKFGRDLRPMEAFATVVGRRHGATLVAHRILDRYQSHGKSPSIVGYFAKATDEDAPKFTTKSPGISNSFSIAGDTPNTINLKTAYHAVVPIDLDPYNPSLRITEQKWDPVTGAAISMIIAKKHGINPNHSAKALRESKTVSRFPISFEGRRDLTMEKILVIDPADARDHDDGIMIERTPDGYRTLVVISDVPYYVRPGSALEESARKKGFTHYFPDETFHALPERLVKTASLIQGQSKPVIYVEQFWDLDGTPLGRPEIGAGVISSHKQMTYGEFEDMAQTKRHLVSAYVELGDILIQRMRFEKLNFDMDEEHRKYSYSQMLVASLMIEANTAIPEFLLERNIPFLSRSHTGSDNVAAFNDMREQLEDWGYEAPDDIEDVSNETLRRLIETAGERGDKERVERLIRAEFLNKAVYSVLPYGHFGLNRENYAHATSPIRRYPDQLVLRAVHTALGTPDIGLSEDDINNLAEYSKQINRLQNGAERVARDVKTYYAVRELERLQGHWIRATIGQIDPYRLEIILPERSGLRHYIDMDRLPEGWGKGRRHDNVYFHNTYLFTGANIRVKICDVKPNLGSWGISHMEAPNKFKALQRPSATTGYNTQPSLGIA